MSSQDTLPYSLNTSFGPETTSSEGPPRLVASYNVCLFVCWLVCLFTVLRLAQEFPLAWRRHHFQWRAAKFRPMLGAQGLWAGRDLYRATSVVTWELSFSGLIRRTAPFSRLLRYTMGRGVNVLYMHIRLLRYTRGCGESTYVFYSGSSRVPIQSPLTTHNWM
jgi:hypothetical protein